MLTALVVYLAVAFLEGAEPRFAVFTEQAACETAVAQVREAGVFVSDCIPVPVPAPRNGK